MARLMMVVMLAVLGCGGASGGGERGEIFLRFDSDAIAERAAPLLKERMKLAGVRGGKITAEGGGRVRVSMDPRDLRSTVPLVTRIYGLEICDVVVDLDLLPLEGKSDKVVEEELRLAGTLGPGQRYVSRSGELGREGALLINSTAVITREHVKKARADKDDFGAPMVEVHLTREGAVAFEALSRRSVGKKVAILIDGDLLSAPVVAEPIPGGTLWVTFGQGVDAGGEARRLAAALRTPRLPYKPVFESSGLAGPSAR